MKQEKSSKKHNSKGHILPNLLKKLNFAQHIQSI